MKTVKLEAHGSALDKAVENVKEKLESQKRKNKITTVETKKQIKEKVIARPKRKRRDQKSLKRGIVYVGHIPHGFYEAQMEEYFKQFGQVIRVRLCRSKVTGRSRGYGYIEFRDCDVAKIAAETMNNYLMCGRLLKATYIPPEKQHNGFFTRSRWTKEHYPRMMNRVKETRIINAFESRDRHKSFVDRSIEKLARLSKSLEKKGIELNFEMSSPNA